MTTPTAQEYASDTAVAIIGMAGRFPGAANVDAFWRNLVGGVESIVSFSDRELHVGGGRAGLLQNPNYVKAGAVVKDVESFDAGFFGFTPREAETDGPAAPPVPRMRLGGAGARRLRPGDLHGADRRLRRRRHEHLPA